MPLVSVPIKTKERYVNLCLETRDAKTYSDYARASAKARVLSDVIQDEFPDAWFIIISEADMAVNEDACCGIVFRTESDFATRAKAE